MRALYCLQRITLLRRGIVMADQSSEPRPKRRYTRRTTAAASTSTRGRKRSGGPELVENLNKMISDLIKENRKLKRQVEKLSAGAAGAAGSGVERGLRTIQRRIQRAMASGAAPARTRRRRSTSTSSGTTTTRRRGRPPKSETSSS